MRVYHLIKVYLLLIACGYALYRSVESVIVANREHAPSAISLDHFERDYHGQQWLALTGRIDFDQAVERTLKNDRTEVWAPMRATNDSSGEAAHVFVLFGPFPTDELERSLAQYARSPATVTGTQVSFDPDRVLPRVAHGNTIIMVQAGNTPTDAGTAWGMTLLFGGLFLFLVWLLIVRPLRRAARFRPQPATTLGVPS